MGFVAVVNIIFMLSFCYAENLNFLTDDFIKTLNENQTTWKAGRNFPDNTTAEYVKRLCGGRPLLRDPNLKAKLTKISHDFRPVPKRFDAREKWPNCKSIAKIRNQGNCASCWALAVTSIMTDRLCISTKGDFQFEFSAEDLLTCCSGCSPKDSNACAGSLPTFLIPLEQHWTKHGIVSGGEYNSHEGCKPYSESSFNGNAQTCESACRNSSYNVSYDDDLNLGNNLGYVDGEDIEQIQIEIMLNGPVVLMFDAHADIMSYHEGVYMQFFRHLINATHAVKIIGWGIEAGFPYWLVANSWGKSWGKLDGYLKIIKGINHCGIESFAIAGTPSLDKASVSSSSRLTPNTLLVLLVNCFSGYLLSGFLLFVM